jgi:hypothetical protein
MIHATIPGTHVALEFRAEASSTPRTLRRATRLPWSTPRCAAAQCASRRDVLGRRCRRYESATGGSGSPKDERGVWPLTASPQIDQPIGDQPTRQDEVVRRQWRGVERLQGQNTVAAACRAEPAGRSAQALFPGRGIRFGELGLTERAAQPVRLPPHRRGRLSAQVGSLFSGRGRPNRFGHDDPSSRACRARCVEARQRSLPPERTRPRISPTIASIHLCGPVR